MSLPAIRRRSPALIDRRSAPSKAMRSADTVAVGGKRPIAASIATDLPEPDSPTIASTSLRSSVRSNPSTAVNGPWRVANETERLRISRRDMGKSDKTRYLVSEAGFDSGAFRHDEAHFTAEVIDASASKAGRARPI